MDTSLQQIRTFNHYLFSSDFYDGQELYMFLHGELPSQFIIRGLNCEKALEMTRKEFGEKIQKQLMQSEMNCNDKKASATAVFLVMEEKLLAEFSYNSCTFYHMPGALPAIAETLCGKFAGVKKRARKKPLEINMITQGIRGLEISEMEIKRTRLDIGLYYEDDFKEVDETIRKRLNQKNDKGIVLLHGLPGTGKTTYLRYLVGRIKKRVMFVPPDIAGRMSNPELVKLLIDNPNSVLIIEDAESIIMQRRLGGDSAVSSLLNISDGLMSDFLSAQLICTFNSSLEDIDSALMRKGRLIARYEFGKLSVEKATKLSSHLGFKEQITEPMTVAEITNQQDRSYEQSGRSMIGFRTGMTVGP